MSTLPVRRRELLLWSWTRRSAKQHSSAQTSASNPMTTPVQTEKNPRQRWMMQASATPGGGENINEKQKTVQSTMQSWMESKGHKANILNEKYTKVGFGRAKDESGSYYWVQMFAKTK